MRRIDLEADRPTLVGEAGTITADRLVVTAGAWTQRLVPAWPVPLQTTRQQVLYVRPPDLAPYSPGRFPVFIVKGRGELDDYYGMPAFDGFGVKVARHGGSETDPDTPDPVVGEAYRLLIRNVLRNCLPDLADSRLTSPKFAFTTSHPVSSFNLVSLRAEATWWSPVPAAGTGSSSLA